MNQKERNSKKVVDFFQKAFVADSVDVLPSKKYSFNGECMKITNKQGAFYVAMIPDGKLNGVE